MTELKTCPFCGGEAEMNGIKTLFHIRCKHCGAATGLFIDKEVAAEAWNRRVDNGN